MTRGFNTASATETKDEWLTPRYITDALGKFDLDVCEPIGRFNEQPALSWIGDHGFCVNDDGLKENWFGRVWCNPPYGKETFKWLKKLSDHKSGIALIFARTDTKGFHSEIFSKAHSIFFFAGRLKFHHVDGSIGDTANAASCLISYSLADTDSIKKSELKGKLCIL